MKEVIAPGVELGLAELAEGRWEAARAAFVRALEAGEEPEALEGLSWAAWWLDDAATLFAARERAFRLYKRRGEPAGAARMATWLACDELDFNGATAVASGWLRRAARLLEPLEPGPDHGWLWFQTGFIAALSGDTASARELAVSTADLGRRCGVADLEMLGLALEGRVLVTCARVSEGMRCLDEATATALEGDATIPISIAWTCCMLVSACVEVRDYRRAFEWCDRIAEFAERYRSGYMRGFCREHYGAVHLSRGRWQDAETELDAAVRDLSRSRPAYVPGALVWLAELRRRQGRPTEAERLLADAGEGAGAQLCRASLALDRGDAARAAELAERCLRQSGGEQRLGRLPALELLAHARIARGELEAAAAAVEALRAIELPAGVAALRAAADLAQGALEAARGRHERARPLLEDAVDAFERGGTPFEAARARIGLAASLVALGRADMAEQELRAAFARLEELGAAVEAQRARALLDAPRTRPAGLTPREHEVLLLLTEGLTNRQIAARLVVSEHTVHRHVTSILRKLALPSRAAAAVYAVRAGL